ncbi:MAG: hypothetical protein LBH60_00875 [Prevotellaceae bacterium]|nr:hypothetical protein [Prevotellaceae bacterium]
MNDRIFKLLFIICLLTVQTSLSAQKKYSSRTGVTFSSFGVNDLFGKSGSGNYIYEGKSFYTLGLTFIKGLNKWLEIETGLEYSRHNISLASNVFPGLDIFMRTRKTELSLLGIPVTMKVNFLKYFFINAGILIDVDVSNSVYFDNQTGFGGIAGFGANYDFKSGLSVFLNPYIKAHSWIDVGENQKILEKGFRLGVTYDLRKILKK